MSTQFLPEDDSFLSFDPMAVWIALEGKYGGTGGSDIAYGQSAGLLASLFRLKMGMPMETKAGAVILNLTVYLGSFDLKHSKRKVPRLPAILIMSQSADRQLVIPAWMPESSHKDVNLGVAIKPFSNTYATGKLPSMALDSGIHAGMTAMES